MTENQFREAYIEALKSMAGKEEYSWVQGATIFEIEACVDKMIDSLKENCHKKWDFLGNNPAMRKAAKKFGVTSSPKLREIAATW